MTPGVLAQAPGTLVPMTFDLEVCNENALEIELHRRDGRGNY